MNRMQKRTIEARNKIADVLFADANRLWTRQVIAETTGLNYQTVCRIIRETKPSPDIFPNLA